MIKKLDYWRNLELLGTHDKQARLKGDLELGKHMINKLDYWRGLEQGTRDNQARLLEGSRAGDTCDKQARQWGGGSRDENILW